MQRILITGAASGLGKGLAETWAKRLGKQAKICIADVNDERGHEVVSQLQGQVADVLYVHCDITSESDISELANILQTRWGGVDTVVNNAGVATGGSLLGESIEQWQWVMDINVLGMVRVSQRFLPMFRKQGSGRFINIASQAGITPVPCMGSYNAAKAAVVGLSETWYLEFKQQNIDVHVVCPSFFKTNLDESMRTSEPTARMMMDRMFDKATMTTEQVAAYILDAVDKQQFLIVTHPEGRLAYRLKKFLSRPRYLATMAKKTGGMVKRMLAEHQERKGE